MSAKAAASAVVASAPVTAMTSGTSEALLSVALGLMGVVLARTVFVDRENRKLQRKQSFRETAPLTAVAMLIAGVWIWDQKLGLSMAVFTGLGVGWVAILLLDILGKRVIAALRALLSADPQETLPPEMKSRLSELDKID